MSRQTDDQTPYLKRAGTLCRQCKLGEDGCARAGGCCVLCTHRFGGPPVEKICVELRATTAKVSDGPAPYIAVCLDCGRISTQQRLISVAFAQLAILHTRRATQRKAS